MRDLADDLLLTCTDRGQHPSTQLARVSWMPEMAAGVAVWLPGDEDAEPRAIRENTRTSKAGETRLQRRQPVEVIDRADGGVTFHLPACPRCRRRVRLRDDTLNRIRAEWHHNSCDVSLLNW
jgi:hypothetical protein